MSELNDKQLAIIDNYAVHILAGLINSPHFDPSEFKSTEDMMQQQCELAYVYAEKLLISRNRYMQHKKGKRNMEAMTETEKGERCKKSILTSFIKQNMKETQFPSMPTIKKDGTGLYDYYKQYFNDYCYEDRYMLSISSFGKIILEVTKEVGMQVWKKRTSKGIFYNLEKLN